MFCVAFCTEQGELLISMYTFVIKFVRLLKKLLVLCKQKFAVSNEFDILFCQSKLPAECLIL